MSNISLWKYKHAAAIKSCQKWFVEGYVFHILNLSSWHIIACNIGTGTDLSLHDTEFHSLIVSYGVELWLFLLAWLNWDEGTNKLSDP